LDCFSLCDIVENLSGLRLMHARGLNTLGLLHVTCLDTLGVNLT
jgi:hypothetical protein